MQLAFSFDDFKLAWAAGFFDGEGCVSIAKPVNSPNGDGKKYHSYQLQIIVAQRDRRPMDALVGLFGGGITPVKIHGSTYWYFRRHGRKATPILQAILPFLVLKREQAELAIRFQKFHDETRPHRRDVGRTPEQMETLDLFYQQSRAMNARFKEKDWTQMGKENNQLTN